jgi:hypothetical protein
MRAEQVESSGQAEQDVEMTSTNPEQARIGASNNAMVTETQIDQINQSSINSNANVDDQ